MRISVDKFEKNLKLIIPKEYKVKKGYLITFSGNEIKELYEYLKNITKEPIINNDKRYWDDIATYSKKVERRLSVSMGNPFGNLNIRLIAYTDKDDDNWIELTPKRISKLAGMIFPYVSLQNSN